MVAICASRARARVPLAQLRHQLRNVGGERDRLGQALLFGLHLAQLTLKRCGVGVSPRGAEFAAYLWFGCLPVATILNSLDNEEP